jgi:alkanesulfonate monooxygenase SsuD/methylene tetrahydromethanopterin reductase-like flavin-dependent oxidoreductase (luciferase family)
MFSWQDMSSEALKEHSKILDFYNYDSMLLVYDPKHEDYFIRVANIIDKTQKIKYMFAIRTYAVSPEFLGMMCESFNKIDPNRITLNICAGDKPQMENEKDIDGLVEMDTLKNDVYERILYTRKWTEKFVNLKVMSKKPYLVFSGTSDYTLKTAEMYGDSTLCMYDSFIDNPNKFKITKNNMISLAMIISDSEESSLKIFESYSIPHAKRWTLFGTEDQIKEKIIDLKNMGITDILVSNPFRLEDSSRIHNLVKSLQ